MPSTATGNVIPPASVFDVKNAAVAVTPRPTGTKTFQFGSVFKARRFTLDADAYFIKAQNPYASVPDPVTGEPVYYLAGNTISKGFELESNIVVGHGVNVYFNATRGKRQVRRHTLVGGKFLRTIPKPSASPICTRTGTWVSSTTHRRDV